MAMIDANTNPSTPKYVFTLYFLNSNSSNFDIATIPITTPSPNIPSINALLIKSSLNKAFIVLIIGY